MAALAVPRAAEAQRTGKVSRIGVLFEGSRLAEMQGPEPRSPILREFFRGLRDLGYVEGQNVVFERRSAEGRPERLPALAAELVRLEVDVILASGEEYRTRRHPLPDRDRREPDVPVLVDSADRRALARDAVVGGHGSRGSARDDLRNARA